MRPIIDSPRIKEIEKNWGKPIGVLFYDWHWKDNLKHGEIAERVGFPRPTITRWFRQFKIPTQPCTRFTNLNLWSFRPDERPRAKPKIKREFSWKVNKEFFKTWSPEMAYVFGFFVADGNMIKNNRGAHFINFYSTDLFVIEKIRKFLNSNHKISIKNKSRINPIWKDCYQLQIGSKEVFNDLISLGGMPNKSLVISMPAVPQEYLGHFVRGYFDGDGHVSVCEYQKKDRKNKSRIIITGFTSGSGRLLEGLRIALKKYANTQGGSLCYTQGYHLCFSAYDSLRLYDFMYKDDRGLYLERKKSKFKHYFKNWARGVARLTRLPVEMQLSLETLR